MSRLSRTMKKLDKVQHRLDALPVDDPQRDDLEERRRVLEGETTALLEVQQQRLTPTVGQF